jgi:hypothetical protein
MATNEYTGLAAEFGRASRRVASALFDVYRDAGDQFAKDWANNARQTSGAHGKWYPDSIDSQTHVSMGIEVEVGPNSAKKQGSMGRGFEFGSQNQPPHLDGVRAMTGAEERLARMADAAIGHLLP